MLGLGEVAVIAGAGLLIIGPHGFPRAAYGFGKTLGLTVRLLRRANEAMSSFSKRHQIAELHEQLQSGLNDINAIRSEWHQLTNRQMIQSSLLGHQATSATAQTTLQSSASSTPTPTPPLSPTPHTTAATAAAAAGTQAPASPQPSASQPPSTPPARSSQDGHAAMLEMSAKTVKSQQQGVAGSDYLNVALAAQQLARQERIILQQQQPGNGAGD